MIFRWSDGHSHAVEFPADEQSLAGASAVALERFQRQTAKRFHDGATHRNLIHYPRAELHFENSGGWFNPGQIHTTDGGLNYFSAMPFTVRATTVEDSPEVIAGHFDQTAFLIMVKAAELWQRVETAARWAEALHGLAESVADTVANADVWPFGPEGHYE